MGTKTIGLDDEAYDRLRAEKREDESFSDAVKRITGEVAADWRRNLGKYSGDAEEFARAVRESRERTNAGLTSRQRDADGAADGTDGASE